MNFLAWAVMAIVSSVISYVIAPKPPQAQRAETKDMDSPTAEAGKPIPVVFGTVMVKGVNTLWFGDKRKEEREL